MKFLSWLKDNLQWLLGSLLMLGMIYYIVGCQPTSQSLLDPDKHVTGDILMKEFQLIAATYEKRIADIELQQKIRNILLQESLTLANTGQLNPVGIITSLMSIFGVAATADAVRSRKKLKHFTLSVKTSTNETTAEKSG